MSNQPERDPAEGITGIDTFGLWLVGYRARLLATIPREFNSVPTLPRHDELISSMLEHVPETFDPHADILLWECPWIEVPLSIQTVLQKQYPSAEADVEKYVDVEIENDYIGFRLRSPLVMQGIETYGEYKTSFHGLVLQIQARDSTPWSRSKVGKWLIHKFPVDLHTEIDKDRDRDKDRWERVYKKIRKPPELIPATVNELQDLVRFLEKSKHRTEVRELQIEPTE